MKRKIIFVFVLLVVLLLSFAIIKGISMYKDVSIKETTFDTNVIDIDIANENEVLENSISQNNEIAQNSETAQNIVIEEPKNSVSEEPKTSTPIETIKETPKTTPKETVENTNNSNAKTQKETKEETQTKQIEVPLNDERHYFDEGAWAQESDWFEADFDF